MRPVLGLDWFPAVPPYPFHPRARPVMKTAAVQAGAALRFEFFPRCRFLLCGESEHHRAVGLVDAADDGGPELAFDRFVPLAACLSASS